MNKAPSRERLNELVNSLSELKAHILKKIGPPTFFLREQAASVEPLKTPIFVMRQILGYADFPQSREQQQWFASFKTSPSDFLSECILQIKNGDIPVDDLDLRRTLIDFYSDMITAYE